MDIPRRSNRFLYCLVLLLRREAAVFISNPAMFRRMSSSMSELDMILAQRRQTRALLRRSTGRRRRSTSANTCERNHDFMHDLRKDFRTTNIQRRLISEGRSSPANVVRTLRASHGAADTAWEQNSSTTVTTNLIWEFIHGDLGRVQLTV